MRWKVLSLLLLLAFASSCSSYKQFKYITEDFELPAKIYPADFNKTWKAIIEVVKKFDISLNNIESGVIKTRWMDNTQELNFADSFSNNDAVKAAKYKLTINASKGFRGGREVTKVTIYRRQLVEQDFLTGWKEIPSDVIQEKVILYRISRLIKISNELNKLDEAKEKEAIENF